MPRDPLHALLKLHRLSVDEARRGLAERLREESKAAAAFRHATTELSRQAKLASHPAQEMLWADPFAQWLPRGRTAAQETGEALAHAEAGVTDGRAALGLARAAARATEDLLARRTAEIALTRARKDQAALDEAGQRYSIKE